MRAVIRLFFVIPIAFVLACIAAGLVFVVAVIGIGPDAAYLVDRLPETLLLAAGVSAVAGGFGAVPALVAILVAEIFGWRSLILYLVAGLLAGLTAAAAATPAPDCRSRHPDLPRRRRRGRLRLLAPRRPQRRPHFSFSLSPCGGGPGKGDRDSARSGGASRRPLIRLPTADCRRPRLNAGNAASR